MVQEGGRWFRTGTRWWRTGSCWYLLMQESGRWCLLVQEGDRWCRKAVAGAGLAAAGAELVNTAAAWKWPPVQEW